MTPTDPAAPAPAPFLTRDRWPALARLASDWAPALALAAAAAHELAYNDSGALDWLLAQALAWPLLLRRRFPQAVLATTLLVALACWLERDLFSSYLAVLFALYSVVARTSWPRALAATAVVEAGVILVAVRFGPTGSANDAALLLTALVVTSVSLGTTQRVQRRYLGVLEERARQLERERDQQARIGAAEERGRIAREVHDIVAHSVSVMITLSEGAVVRGQSDPARASEIMQQVAATGRDALTELRKVVAVLRTPGAEGREPQPGLDRLTHLADDVRRAGLPVELRVDGDVRAVPEVVSLNAYRIVQESLTNVRKHAHHPTRAVVAVEAGPDRVSLRIEDDGRPGRPRDRENARPGNGIQGMRERTRIFGGSLEAGPTASGWLVHASLDPRMMTADPR